MPRFWRVFFTVTLCIAAVIVLLAVGFAFYMRDYENSRPENLADKFMSEFTTDDLETLIADNFPDNCGDFLSKEETVHNIIMPLFENGVKCIKSTGEYTSETPVYTLTGGDRTIARVTFRAVGKTLFGFTEWSSADVEYMADFSDLHHDGMYINVPGGAEVRYAGMKLGSSYRSGSGKYEGPCAGFEDQSKLPITEIYNVGEGYGMIMPTVTLGDEALTLLSDTSDPESGTHTLKYAYPDSRLSSVTLIVPSEASVYVNGKLASEDYITERGIAYAGLNEWNAAAEHTPTKVRYLFPGLLTDITWKVYLPDNTEITPSDSDEAMKAYVYDYPQELLLTAKINAPVGSVVKVNGVELTEDQITDRDAVCAEIASIASFIKNPANVCLYEVPGLYAEPKVEIISPDGDALDVVISEDGIYSYEHGESQELKEAHEKYVEGFVENYIKYYTDGNRSIAANFQGLILPYLQPGSEAYDYLSKVYSSLAWTAKCTVHEKEIKTYCYQQWGENCFSCSVDFSLSFYSPNSGQETGENVEGWKIYFVNTTGSENGWRIAKIIL